MTSSSFSILKSDTKTAARVGKWRLRHGTVQTPLFMPDATRAVMRGLDNRDTQEAGVTMAVINTLHLALCPGVEYFRQHRGVHPFMRTTMPLLSDSGGFQVMSLARKYPKSRITPEGFHFKDPQLGREFLLTPEHSIDMQYALGSDAMVVLDQAGGPDDTPEQAATGLAQTSQWAQQSLAHYQKLIAQNELAPALFGVIQGGNSKANRKKSYQEIRSDLFIGYGWGGWPLDSEGNVNLPISEYLASLVPDNQMRYGLGIGTPQDIVNLVAMGFDLFDTVLPTRDARHGRVYVDRGYLYLKKKRYLNDDRPLQEDCDCFTCQHYSRRYVHHLYTLGDSLFARLATIHNIRFYTRLMEHIRESIVAGTFAAFHRDFGWRKQTMDEQ